ncbi:MAG: hypothetical protein RL161_526 [Bacteroidota bacterium]|jgi:hypothetical protein
METSKKIRLLHITGLLLLILGSLDPMEGSVLIAIAAVLFALRSRLNQEVLQKMFFLTAVACMIGVTAIFTISSFGGLGGEKGISWWWGLFILPYPLAWLTLIYLLIKSHRKRKAPVSQG